MICEILEAPDGGSIDCTGNFYDDICCFRCDSPLVRIGRFCRLCRDDGTWSDSEVLCRSGKLKCCVLFINRSRS